jgi:hypothetical protein
MSICCVCRNWPDLPPAPSPETVAQDGSSLRATLVTRVAADAELMGYRSSSAGHLKPIAMG